MRTFIRCIAVSAMAFLLLFSACAPATAEGDAGLLELIWEPDEAQRAADLFTEDTVTVDDTDNSVLILGTDVQMRIIPPFGWMILTQDVYAHAKSYIMWVRDIWAMQARMKEENVHAFMVNLLTRTNIKVVFAENRLSGLYRDLGQPDKTVEKALEETAAVWVRTGQVQEASVFRAGSRLYIRSRTGNVIRFETAAKGQGVTILCSASDGDTLSESELDTIGRIVASGIVMQ